MPLVDSNIVNFTTQVSYVGKQLWTALGTVVRHGNDDRSGILHSIVRPEIQPRSGGRPPLLTAEHERTTRFGIPNHDLMFPAVGVTSEGRALVSYSITGGDFYPSTAYSRLDRAGRFGAVQITGPGQGPVDGFTGYGAFNGNSDPVNVNRFGDYAATAIVGDDVWIAGAYVGQTCTLAEFAAGADDPDPGFTCGETRGPFSNWYTRIAKVPLGD
jgi:hypothetical protein